MQMAAVNGCCKWLLRDGAAVGEWAGGQGVSVRAAACFIAVRANSSKFGADLDRGAEIGAEGGRGKFRATFRVV